jgi:hypothetical protein
LTREEALAWIDEHAGQIAVRDTVNGKLGSYFLTELPFTLRELHRQRLATRKVLGVPVHRLVK